MTKIVTQAGTLAERLRAALIECGRHAGAYLADDVSNEFLMRVPGEVEARLKADRIASEQATAEQAFGAGWDAALDWYDPGAVWADAEPKAAALAHHTKGNDDGPT